RVRAGAGWFLRFGPTFAARRRPASSAGNYGTFSAETSTLAELLRTVLMSARSLTARPGGAGPVLVVEDDPDIRQALAELLEDEGYECMLAQDGRAALESLSRRMPSLLLVDLLMPG